MIADPVVPLGKLAPGLLEAVLGAGPPLPPEVVLGPKLGEDACAIACGGETLVAATDPITLTGADVGAHAVVINANDVAAMGARPRWFLATVLLPEGSTESEVRTLFARMHAALEATGAALVGGHTEVTAAVRQTVVVGQMLGIAGEQGIVPTGGLVAGDRVVQIGPAPVEGAAVLAEVLGSRLRDGLGGVDGDTLERARGAIASPGISVVDAALLATSLGARAMHDPTEGGLATGLHEMAIASGTGLRIDRAAVLWFEPGVAVCQALGADPWGTLASGALLAGFAAADADRAVAALQSAGHLAAVIAEATTGASVEAVDGTAVPRFERDELSRLSGSGESSEESRGQIP